MPSYAVTYFKSRESCPRYWPLSPAPGHLTRGASSIPSPSDSSPAVPSVCFGVCAPFGNKRIVEANSNHRNNNIPNNKPSTTMQKMLFIYFITRKLQCKVFLNTVLQDSENEAVEAASFMLQTNSFVIL